MSTLNEIILNGTGYNLAGIGSGLTDEIKQALLQLASKVAYIDSDGQSYYDDLENALYPPVTLLSISAVYTQSGAVYTTDSLDDLRSDLVVTGSFDDGTSRAITTYTLSGTLTRGVSVITVSYLGETTTFNVIVTVDSVVYQLKNEVFAQDHAIDTNVAIAKNDTDWTITWKGIVSQTQTGNSRIISGQPDYIGFIKNAYNINFGFLGSSEHVIISDFMRIADLSKPLSLVFTHEQGSTDVVAYYSYYDLTDGYTSGSYTFEGTKSTSEINIKIGGYLTGDGYIQLFNGTVYDCTFHNIVLNATEINDYLAGE